jgi:hypothetical protein
MDLGNDMKDAKGHGSETRGGGQPRQHKHASISAHAVHRDIQMNAGHWQAVAPKEGFLGHALHAAVHALTDRPPAQRAQAETHTIQSLPWPYGPRSNRGANA